MGQKWEAKVQARAKLIEDEIKHLGSSQAISKLKRMAAEFACHLEGAKEQLRGRHIEEEREELLPPRAAAMGVLDAWEKDIGRAAADRIHSNSPYHRKHVVDLDDDEFANYFGKVLAELLKQYRELTAAAKEG